MVLGVLFLGGALLGVTPWLPLASDGPIGLPGGRFLVVMGALCWGLAAWYLARTVHATLTLDENGITRETPAGERVSLKWSEIEEVGWWWGPLELRGRGGVIRCDSLGLSNEETSALRERLRDVLGSGFDLDHTPGLWRYPRASETRGRWMLRVTLLQCIAVVMATAGAVAIVESGIAWWPTRVACTAVAFVLAGSMLVGATHWRREQQRQFPRWRRRGEKALGKGA